jgi:hypothetical protein
MLVSLRASGPSVEHSDGTAGAPAVRRGTDDGTPPPEHAARHVRTRPAGRGSAGAGRLHRAFRRRDQSGADQFDTARLDFDHLNPDRCGD